MNQQMFLMNIERAANLLETTNVKQHFGSYRGRDGSLCAYGLIKENKIQLPDVTMGFIVHRNDGDRMSFKEIAKWLRRATKTELMVPLPMQRSKEH